MLDFELEEKNRKENSAPIFSLKKGGGFTPLEILWARRNRKTDKSLTGFTLVEVTVVLAIISLLIVIVIVSTGESKNRSRDAAIQSALMQVRNAAELFYNENKSYDGVCDPADNTLSNSNDFSRIESYISQQGGVNACQDDERAYAVISSLNLGNCWCVDSEGNSKKVELTGSETCTNKLTETTCL